MVGRNNLESDVDGGASRSTRGSSRHRSRLISPKISEMVRPGWRDARQADSVRVLETGRAQVAPFGGREKGEARLKTSATVRR
jgi:hypothetical protein